MDKIEEHIRRRLQRKPICLMTHIIAGYPSFDENLRELEIMAENDVDLVEVQMPFSEPIADGPIFVRANQLSLEQGTTVQQYFQFMERATAQFDFPFLMMGYYNPVFKMGETNFLHRLQSAGATGFIIPDLPIEEGRQLYQKARESGLAAIALMTPTSTEERLKQIGKAGSGFIYVVARKGVTGDHTKFEETFSHYIHKCRSATDLPLAVGFGISQKQDLDYLINHVEMAIIGTRILELWENDGPDGLRLFLQEINQYLECLC